MVDPLVEGYAFLKHIVNHLFLSPLKSPWPRLMLFPFPFGQPHVHTVGKPGFEGYCRTE